MTIIIIWIDLIQYLDIDQLKKIVIILLKINMKLIMNMIIIIHREYQQGKIIII